MTKKISRRKAIGIGVMTPVLGMSWMSCQNKKTPIDKTLRILILGGTSFLGPHQIAYALGRGHKVSIFTRGKTKPKIYTELFEQVEHLVGDRADNLTALENREWDVVIDNSGRREAWTKMSAELLKDKVGIYLYTSSTGVYYPYLKGDIKEDTTLNMAVPENATEMEKIEFDYGVMKAKSEVAAMKAFGADRTIVVRPTYMMGPGDKTDRFIYWPVRLSKGGEVLVPGKATDPVQYIDVRDVAEWMIRLSEDKMNGTYNAVGPGNIQSIKEFVEVARKSFNVPTSFVQVDDHDFLLANNVPYLVPWIMPTEDNFGSARVNNRKALSNGLTLRDLNTSLNEIYIWWNSEDVSQERRDEFEKKEDSLLVNEATILDKWMRRK